MIDTIKLAYPLNSELYAIYEKHESIRSEVSSTGETKWEKSFINDFPSHFCRLRCHLFDNKLIFEFSLQKWSNDDNYNHENTSMNEDIIALERWMYSISSYFVYTFKPELFELYRVDLAVNLILEGVSYQHFNKSVELHLGKSEKNLSRYKTSIWYGSRWIGKKIYHKLSEYKANEKSRRRVNGLPDLIIDEQLMRFEIEVKREYLKNKNILRIEDVPMLENRFIEEKKLIENISSLKTLPKDLSDSEIVVIDLVKNLGYSLAKQEYLNRRSSRTWYRVKSDLKQRGVLLEAIAKCGTFAEGSKQSITLTEV